MPAPAYNALNVTIPQGILQFTLDPGAVLGAGGLALPVYQYPQARAVNLTIGTGVGQLNILGVSKGSLAGAPLSLDLTTGFKDPYGNTLAYAKILALLIWNYSTVAGQNLLVDATVANAFAAFFNNIVTAKLAIGPGIVVGGNNLFLPALLPCLNTGFTVDATHKIISLDPGANSFNYEVDALGIST